ncbi:alpha-1,3-mannosyl-glycoprotein 4-beta-N-acetylglucosaminyltransferase B isoform X3 [Pan troglodytes]|uniref:alpha-1,3-mannosyl-glycoprotein 4-beta-N-acetylglucosaminyltransferase B isoform X3 n=1 Tax=Pan troglodytes TaxID=9598 RepID=UPI0007DBDE88|nr:alpha-1,3-mannosyl-glycoprotein 4-beta-N-acetylglucosaminyltransferase B isoform X1 [Pan troglodytes]
MRLRNGTFLTLLLFCLCAFLSLSWYAALSGQKGDVVDVYQREFLALRDRLHAAEQESLKRSKELNLVLDEIKRAVSERQALRDGDGNRTWGRLTEDPRLKPWNGSHRHVLHLPTVFHHLPHLLAKESSLQPAVRVGQGRTGVSVVMGIPSVRREVHSYLTDTLHSLISELSPQEKEDSVIVVLIAETDSQYTSAVTENIKALFPTEIHSGLLEVISPSPHFYPDFSRLRESFGDPKERVRWRTKQNLDYCFLMMYAQSKGIYYVQLEDDIVAKPNYLSTMKNFALQQPSEDWMILEFSQLGFIGKMFKSLDLSLIVEFILMFYRDKPIDWLLDHILWVKVCNPEKDAKHCDRQKANLRIRFKPSLFQHVGTHSSLAGKIQKLKDKDFGKQALRKEHVNPPAELSTSLKTYQHFTLEKAYLREDFFWAFTPAAGDFIRFRFFQPLRLERLTAAWGAPLAQAWPFSAGPWVPCWNAAPAAAHRPAWLQVLLPQWEHRAPGGQALQHVRGGAALRQPSVRQGGPAGGPHRHPPVPSEPRRLPPDRLLLQGSGRGRGGPSLRPSGSTAPLDPDGLPCVGDSERDLPEKGRLSCGLLRVPCGQP